MRISVAPLVALAVAGCGTLWPTLEGTTPQSARQTLACVGQQAESLGYSLRSKRGDDWVEARKDVPDVEHRNYTEMKRYDILWVTATDRPEGTALKVQARSFSERMTKRGPTPEDEYATDAVQRDAQSVITRCGQTEAQISS